jgi:hypothetical protein
MKSLFNKKQLKEKEKKSGGADEEVWAYALLGCHEFPSDTLAWQSTCAILYITFQCKYVIKLLNAK